MVEPYPAEDFVPRERPEQCNELLELFVGLILGKHICMRLAMELVLSAHSIEMQKPLRGHCWTAVPLFWHVSGSSTWSPESFDWWWWHHRLSNRGTPFRWDPLTCKNKVGCVISEGYQTVPLPTIHTVLGHTLWSMRLLAIWMLFLAGLRSRFRAAYLVRVDFVQLHSLLTVGYVNDLRLNPGEPGLRSLFSDYVILWARSQLTQTRSRHKPSWRFVLFWRKGCKHFCDCIQTLHFLDALSESTGEIFGH